MKKFFLLFILTIILIPVKPAISQNLLDYISEVKGDTLVVKDYYEMNNQPNSLYWALKLDTVNVPPDRVYMLKAGGFYSNTNTSTSSAKHPTVIAGSDPAMVVNNKNSASSPPLICTDNSALGWSVGIEAGGDLTIKNCELVCTANDRRTGINFTYTSASNLNLVFDNCLFEHCAHWFVYMRNDSNQNVTFRNCYFANMNGQPCRRDGGVFISFYQQDTLLVENCTHIMAQGQLYKFEIYPDYTPPFYPHDYQFKRIIFNHNTFINCAGVVFMNPGYQSNVSLTNNIFVNCNVQPFGGINQYDSLEQDPDGLPMGLVNVYDSAKAPIKFYVDVNLVYWDPSLADMESILNANKVNGITDWQSQRITMNARTQSMFDNNADYPYLTEGDWWINKMPNFTDPKDLFTTQLANLKTFALGTVDLNSLDILPDWRLINTDTSSYVNPDWPIPVDLSYTDADLQIAGISGFPIGDLNWFPEQKAAWLAQRTEEYALISDKLYNDKLYTSVNTGNILLKGYNLKQNYPNPFNPATTISFTIPEANYITLKVYNALGQEAATLLDGFKNAQTYNIRFDGTGLASGVYLYRLEAGNYAITKKMVLIK